VDDDADIAACRAQLPEAQRVGVGNALLRRHAECLQVGIAQAVEGGHLPPPGRIIADEHNHLVGELEPALLRPTQQPDADLLDRLDLPEVELDVDIGVVRPRDGGGIEPDAVIVAGGEPAVGEVLQIGRVGGEPVRGHGGVEVRLAEGEVDLGIIEVEGPPLLVLGHGRGDEQSDEHDH
jgi:hypothetical protein